MRIFDETTLDRAAAVYGPYHLEHRFLREYARLNREAGALAAQLVDLLESQPVNEYQVRDALTGTDAVLVDLYIALDLLKALLGFHPAGKAGPFFSLHTAGMNELERAVQRAELAAASRCGCLAAEPAPDTCQYDKREVLELLCAMAAREAAEQKKEVTNGTV